MELGADLNKSLEDSEIVQRELTVKLKERETLIEAQ